MAPAGEFMEDMDSYVSIAEFYKGKSIFITGGTGFLGKVLLEKLLYSCKDVGNLYILVRDKKGVPPEDRLNELKDKVIFSRLKKERPGDLNKLSPIIGDIDSPNLGLSYEDEQKLIEKVSVVIHMAARIKFNGPLNLAVKSNVKGTEYVLNLCHRMKNLKAYVHVSTAYTNTEQQTLEEKVYPPRATLSEVFKFIEQPVLDDKEIKERFLKGLPNTYSFSKGLAENYVMDHRGNIPTVIVRPSIVSPALREPIAGWTDNWFGATGMIIATAKGANRIFLGNSKNVLDLIPVDYVVNATIAAGAKCSRNDDVVVYNTCTSSCNPITLEKLFEDVKGTAIDIGFNDNAYPTVMFTNNKWLLYIITFLLQILPAYIADLFLRLVGREPKYVQIQSRVIFGRNLINFFTTNSWEMKANNVISLYKSLSHADRKIFPCDPTDIDWTYYDKIYVAGIKKYLLKE